MGGAIGRAVRAGIIWSYKLAPGAAPRPCLEPAEWVSCAAIEEVLDEAAEREHLASLQR